MIPKIFGIQCKRTKIQRIKTDTKLERAHFPNLLTGNITKKYFQTKNWNNVDLPIEKEKTEDNPRKRREAT